MKIQQRENIMLAHPATERAIRKFSCIDTGEGQLRRNFFHMPKLNGERGRTDWFEDRPFILSSYGNDFRFIEKIQEELALLKTYFGARKFDGEIYVHGWSRERIDSALRRKKKKNPDSDLLEYHIFDTQDADKVQYERIRELDLYAEVIEKLGLKRIKAVPYGICCEETWLDHCGNYCQEGYEGIILRDVFGKYTMQRNWSMLKFKPHEEDEYIIRGVNEAISQDGIPKAMVGSFTVAAVDEPGNESTFDVGAGKIPHAKRELYWRMKDQLIGLPLIVKHELLKTTNQVPIACVAVDIKGVRL